MTTVTALVTLNSSFHFGAVIVAGAVGVLVLWANPTRRQNQAVALFAALVGLWLLSRWVAVGASHWTQGLKWLRVTTAIGAIIPLQLWHVLDSVLNPHDSIRRVMRRGVWLAILAVGLAIIPLTGWFIPTDSTPMNPRIGSGYFVHFGGLLVCYLALMVASVISGRKRSGIQKLELNVVLLGGVFTAISVIGLMIVRSALGVKVPSYITTFPVVGMFVFWAVAITTHRIFDARHLLLTISQRLVLVVMVSAAAYTVWGLLDGRIPAPLMITIMVVIVLWLAAWLNARLDTWLIRYPKADQARLAAFDAAHSEIRTDELRRAFEKVINGWGQTDRAILLIDDEDSLSGNGIELAKTCPLVQALDDVSWATPERLGRERETPERRLLSDFMKKHALGVLVYEKGPTMSIIVGLGVRPSRLPFTFPEVTQLRELVSIFDSSLSRTQLLAKAQRAEQLATVGLLGASVAHEIRNPLVSIKTFAQLLPKHYSDPHFRERFSRLIGDEVGRIDRLTEQLLDLAAPHAFAKTEVRLHELIQSSLELVMARVTSRNLQLSTSLDASPDIVHSDANGLKQVILNLCFNAVQAQETQQIDVPIKVTVSTRNVGKFVELIVSDNGPGIPDAARLHLFEPFHSTKSNGFGLGLTVCGEILSSLDATIAVDPFVDGDGAVFRVSLPCPPRFS